MDDSERQRVLRGTRMSDDMQPCTICGEIKPAEDFPKREGERRQSRCRTCRAAWRREVRKKNPAKAKIDDREYNVRRHRGMTEALFERMFIEQQGRCGICLIPMVVGSRTARSAHIDHDHDDGRVRELLCSRCNTGSVSLGRTSKS